MSKEIFLISDTHFGHGNILTFKDKSGQPIRPYKTLEEMNEALIDNWNKVARPQDKIYHLGDVAMTKKGLECLKRCNGNKVLIRGNHDIFKLKDYAEHFRDIRGCYVLDGYIFTHIPIHKDCSARFKKNIHGHLHVNNFNDDFYVNVSVEQINFTPINFEELKIEFDNRKSPIEPPRIKNRKSFFGIFKEKNSKHRKVIRHGCSNGLPPAPPPPPRKPNYTKSKGAKLPPIILKC